MIIYFDFNCILLTITTTDCFINSKITITKYCYFIMVVYFYYNANCCKVISYCNAYFFMDEWECSMVL